MNKKAGICITVLAMFAADITATQAGEMELRDPTRPLSFVSASRSAEQNFSLQAIFSSNEHGFKAVINGVLHAENDELGQWKIVDINARAVTLRAGTETKVLSLRKKVIEGGS